MFAVTGKNSTIVQRLEQLTGEEAVRIEPSPANVDRLNDTYEIPEAERYVLAAGVLHGLRVDQIDNRNAIGAFWINLWTPLRLCEAILERRPRARICVIGSQSVPNGSFDRLYAATKAGLHQYVETRKVYKPQQLVCVSPVIIEDSGMTQRRPDFEQVLATRQTVLAIDVAREVQRLLWHPGNVEVTNLIVPVIRRAER